MRIVSLAVALVSSLCLYVVLASPGNGHREVLLRRHNGISLFANDAGDHVASSENLHKRFSSTRFTFYKTGLGACGGVNNDNDFIVAMNHAQFDSGNWCGKTITVEYNGKSTQATVVDRCEECPFGALDFSPGLFNFFASAGAGIIYGSWTDGAPPPPPPPPPPPAPSTTKPPPPPPSSTYVSSSVSISSSTNTSMSTTTSTSASVLSTPTPAMSGPMWDVNKAIIQLGGMAVSGARDASH